MRLLSALNADLRFQFRHGFYGVYIIVVVLYILILRGVPDELVSWVSVFLILSDTSVLGFFFIGGILILERGQGILNALFITPLRSFEYLISKVVSLSFLALAASLLIIVAGTGILKNLLTFSACIFLTSSLFILLGCIIAGRSQTVNSYFASSILYLFPMFLPLLGFFNIYSHPVFYLIPTQPVITVTSSLFRTVPFTDILISFAVLAAWNAGAGYFAYRIFTSSLRSSV